VHWLSITDGKFAARAQLSKDPIEAAPIVVGDIVYVMDVEGEIGAFRAGAGK
jgi:outer membrane protein assembly factor BamB